MVKLLAEVIHELMVFSTFCSISGVTHFFTLLYATYKIDKLSKEGNPDAIPFPRAHIEDSPYDFSFSGLKTAVINYVHKLTQKGEEINVADVCASFQKEVTNELVGKTILACEKLNANKLVVAGGVSANSKLKETLKTETEKRHIQLFMPELVLCTDNAAMIGSAAYYLMKDGLGLSDLSLTAKATVSL